MLNFSGKRLIRSTGLAGLVLGALWATSVLAQQAGTATGTSQGSPDAGSGVSDQRLSELFYQLQVLQQEVQELRGLVEEQSYQLNRLARDQKEQYIDLDRRVAGLTTGATAGTGISAGLAQPGSGTANPTNSGSTATTTPGFGAAPAANSTAGAAGTGISAGAGAGVSEREAYQSAFDLMKGRKFEESIAAFNRLVVDYPNGQYTPNAFYWLGELYLAQQDTEQARQSFMQVINLYPDHPKVPDTLYKLGVAYHRLGDTNRAMEYFAQVQSRYPQSSAAGLAASYQQEIR